MLHEDAEKRSSMDYLQPLKGEYSQDALTLLSHSCESRLFRHQSAGRGRFFCKRL